MNPAWLPLLIGCTLQTQDVDDSGEGGNRDTVSDTAAPVDSDDTDDPAPKDSDEDGLSDEAELAGADGTPGTGDETDPNAADTDNDGLSDGDEVLVHGTDPNAVDTDNDGLSDGDEVLVHETDPNNPDTDAGGITDGEEVAAGTDPNEASDDSPSAVSLSATTPALGGESVTVEASVAEGATVTYAWSQTSGDDLGLGTQDGPDADASALTFTPPADGGTYAFTVVVTVDGVALPAASITVEVQPAGSRVAHVKDVPFYQWGDYVNDAAIVGDTAWVTFSTAPADPTYPGMEYRGHGIQAVDMSEPSHLVPGVFLPMEDPDEITAWGTTIAVTGYGTSPREVRLFDVSDPANPQHLSTLADPALADVPREMIAVDGYLYVGVGVGQIVVIDATDPAQPAVVNTTPAPSTNSRLVGEFVLDGTTLYVYWRGTNGYRVQILDVSTPSAPVELAALTSSNHRRPISVSDGLLAHCTGSGLAIVDVSTPATPVTLATHSSIPCTTVFLDGTDVYAARKNGTETVHYSLTDPLNPTQVGYLSATVGNVDGIYQDLLFTLSAQRLKLVDPTLTIDRRVGGFNRTDTAESVHLSQAGDALYAVDQGDIAVFDISDPKNPVQTALLDQGRGGYYMAAGHGLLALGTYEEGVELYDISDPLAPSLLTPFLPSSNDVYVDWVDFSEDSPHLIVGDTTYDRIYVVDVSTPSAPVVVSELDSPYPSSTRMRDGILLSGDQTSVYAYDLSDPAAPVPLIPDGYYDGERGGWGFIGVYPFGDVGVGVGWDVGYVFDFQDPDVPAYLRHFGIPGQIDEPRRFGDTILGSTWEGSIAGVDVSDPSRAFLAMEVESRGDLWDIAYHNGVAYQVTNSPELLWAELPERPVLSGAPTSPQARGSQVSLTATWTPWETAVDELLTCAVEEGQCEVVSQDLAAGTATLTWTLPDRVGEHNLVFAVGQQDWFAADEAWAEVAPNP